jgi:hypothetical protein
VSLNVPVGGVHGLPQTGEFRLAIGVTRNPRRPALARYRGQSATKDDSRNSRSSRKHRQSNPTVHRIPQFELTTKEIVRRNR